MIQKEPNKLSEDTNINKVFAFYADEVADAWLIGNHPVDEKDSHSWEVDN